MIPIVIILTALVVLVSSEAAEQPARAQGPQKMPSKRG
jgi:hypothetical protein